MSIKETSDGIGRRRGRPPGRTLQAEDVSFSNRYGRDILEHAFWILREAGVPAFVQEATNGLRQEFPDVEVIKLIDAQKGNYAGSEVRWNFITTSNSEWGKTFKYSSVSVLAMSESESAVIHVFGGKRIYGFTKDKWSRNPEIIKDAMAEVIKDPKECYSFDE